MQHLVWRILCVFFVPLVWWPWPFCCCCCPGCCGTRTAAAAAAALCIQLRALFPRLSFSLLPVPHNTIHRLMVHNKVM